MRAREAALLGTPFATRTMGIARHASRRVVDRWAPEGHGQRRGGALGALAFADRMLSGYVGSALAHDSSGNGGTQLRYGESPLPTRKFSTPPPTSWLFPVPWYQDELNWLEAARKSATEQHVSGAAFYHRAGGAGVHRAGGAGVAKPSARASVAARAMAAPLVDLSLIAPAIFAGSRRRRPAPSQAARTSSIGTSSPRVAAAHGIRDGVRAASVYSAISETMTAPALRAWSPLVSFQATQAAEVMAGALAQRNTATSVASSDGGRPYPITVMELVAPRDLARRATAAGTLAMGRADAGRAQGRARPGPLWPPSAKTPASSPAKSPASSPAISPAISPSVVRRIEAAERVARESLAQVPAAVSTHSSQMQAASDAPAIGTRESDAVEPSLVSAPGYDAGAAAIELLAASVVGEESRVLPASGPRVAMPAGLGGLIAGVHAASTVARPLVASRTPFTAPSMSGASMTSRLPQLGLHDPAPAPEQARTTTRGAGEMTPRVARRQALSASGGPRPSVAPIYLRSALSVIEDERPTALGHIAWADHWLARFGGAGESALASMDVATERLQHLQPNAAEVFLSLPGADRAAASGTGNTGAPGATEARAVAALMAGAGAASTDKTARLAQPAQPTVHLAQRAPRMADDAAVPDAMFETLARAAQQPRSRLPEQMSADPRAAVVSAPKVAARTSHTAQPTHFAGAADRLLTMPPVVPGAGLRAGLAASPVAPALGELLGLADGPTFDVRTTSPGGVARAYLSGAIRPIALRATAASRPQMVGPMALIGRGSLPMPAGVAPTHSAVLRLLAGRAPESTMVIPSAASRESFLSPAAEGQRRVEQGAMVLGDRRVPTVDERVASLGSTVVASTAASDAANHADTGGAAGADAAGARGRVPAYEPSYVASGAPSDPPADVSSGLPHRGARDALGSAAVASASMGPAAADLSTVSQTAFGAGHRQDVQAQWNGGLGQTGQLARAWAVERSQEINDLAFDFVSPELVMAAAEYGFGAAEAAQASRLAMGGSTQLATMASALDFAFVSAASEQRQAASGAVMSQMPQMPMLQAAGGGIPSALGAREGAYGDPAAMADTMAGVGSTRAAEIETGFIARSEAVGVASDVTASRARRPRGVFMWPKNTLDALQVTPGDAELENPLALAALDLIAAHVVADAATAGPGREVDDTEAGTYSHVRDDSRDGHWHDEASARAEAVAVAAPLGAGQDQAIPAEFQSIYVALAMSPEGRAMTPSVRAARAFALAGRRASGSSHPAPSGVPTARQRAAAAWAVMPMVLTRAGDGPFDAVQDAVQDGPDRGAANAFARPADMAVPVPPYSSAGRSLRTLLQGQPGARGASESPGFAGAPGVYVSAAASDGYVGSREERGRQALSQSAPAQSMVQTGSSERPADLELKARALASQARSAEGGEELPAWLEAAARKMLEQPGDSEGISLAEMTLISAAPARHVAASPHTADAPSRAVAQEAAAAPGDAAQPDVDELARKVYAKVRQMLQIARERNGGEPWL